MNQRRSFWRKVSYVAAIVVLLIPMSMLSMPASGGRDAQGAAGGKLAQMRAEHGLGQASLGEIDPASETMKLATLGMRGIAANILWGKAIEYKKTENWTKFQATLEQIARLQPNFISVWQYQAWNLSYNLSVEFDDYHDRYRWVMRGIDYLAEGLRYNHDEPRLLWDRGWFIAQKIGRADEHLQYRRLFKRDEEFHADSNLTFEQRDNWLVGKYWFQEAIDAVDLRGKRMKGKTPLIYRADPALAQINYATAIQTEGTHGEQAWSAWVRSGQDWKKYGDSPVLSSDGLLIELNDAVRSKDKAEEYRKELESLVGGVHENILRDRLADLTEDERKLQQLELEDVPSERLEEYYRLQGRVNVTPLHIAERIEKDHPEVAVEAARLGKLWSDAQRRASVIERYRETINFDYWEARCRFEQTQEAIRGRELLYKAALAHDEQDLLLARKLYEEAWPLWRTALDDSPRIRDEGMMAEEVIEHIVKYRRVLEDLSIAEFPQDFILRDIVEHFDRENLVRDVFVTPVDQLPKSSKSDEKANTEPEKKPDATPAPASKAETATPESKEKDPLPAPAAEGAPPEPEAETSSPATDATPTADSEKPPAAKTESANKPEAGAPPESLEM